MTTVPDELFAELEARLPGAVTRDVPLSGLTTYKLGGPVALLVRVRREDDLGELADVVRVHRPPLLFVGRGSNLLVADTGFAGVGVVLEGDLGRSTSGDGRTVGAETLRCRCSPGAAPPRGAPASSSSASRAAWAARCG
jgi:UDP-N-acetylmuramate dehydrogenase